MVGHFFFASNFDVFFFVFSTIFEKKIKWGVCPKFVNLTRKKTIFCVHKFN